MSAQRALIACAEAHAQANKVRPEREGTGLFLAGFMLAARIPGPILQRMRLEYSQQNPHSIEGLDRWAEIIVTQAMGEASPVIDR